MSDVLTVLAEELPVEKASIACPTCGYKRSFKEGKGDAAHARNVARVHHRMHPAHKPMKKHEGTKGHSQGEHARNESKPFKAGGYEHLGATLDDLTKAVTATIKMPPEPASNQQFNAYINLETPMMIVEAKDSAEATEMIKEWLEDEANVDTVKSLTSVKGDSYPEKITKDRTWLKERMERTAQIRLKQGEPVKKAVEAAVAEVENPTPDVLQSLAKGLEPLLKHPGKAGHQQSSHAGKSGRGGFRRKGGKPKKGGPMEYGTRESKSRRLGGQTKTRTGTGTRTGAGRVGISRQRQGGNQ